MKQDQQNVDNVEDGSWVHRGSLYYSIFIHILYFHNIKFLNNERMVGTKLTVLLSLRTTIT